MKIQSQYVNMQIIILPNVTWFASILNSQITDLCKRVKSSIIDPTLRPLHSGGLLLRKVDYTQDS